MLQVIDLQHLYIHNTIFLSKCRAGIGVPKILCALRVSAVFSALTYKLLILSDLHPAMLQRGMGGSQAGDGHAEW